MSDVEIVEYRHPAKSSDEDRDEAARGAQHRASSESGIGRRPLDPQLAPRRDRRARPAGRSSRCATSARCRATSSSTRSGRRACASSTTSTAHPIKPEDMEVGQLVNAEPAVFFENDADGEPVLRGRRAPAARRPRPPSSWCGCSPRTSRPAKGRENWGVDGHPVLLQDLHPRRAARSRLWEQQTHHLLCPCHQSTFDLADNGKVIFGPAARPLPQLPVWPSTPRDT